jgi:hypothetical protein
MKNGGNHQLGLEDCSFDCLIWVPDICSRSSLATLAALTQHSTIVLLATASRHCPVHTTAWTCSSARKPLCVSEWVCIEHVLLLLLAEVFGKYLVFGQLSSYCLPIAVCGMLAFPRPELKLMLSVLDVLSWGPLAACAPSGGSYAYRYSNKLCFFPSPSQRPITA